MVWFILGRMYAPLTWHRATMRIRQTASLTGETIVSLIVITLLELLVRFPSLSGPVLSVGFDSRSERSETGDGCCHSSCVSSALKLALNCLTRQ